MMMPRRNCYRVIKLMGRKAGWYTAAASIYARGTGRSTGKMKTGGSA